MLRYQEMAGFMDSHNDFLAGAGIWLSALDAQVCVCLFPGHFQERGWMCLVHPLKGTPLGGSPPGSDI